MIEYVVPHNPDDRILTKACALMKAGELICFPTDTNWIVTADINSKKGIEKLYKIKSEQNSKHFSLLCDSISTASEIALISDFAFRMLKRTTPGNYTFIFEANKSMVKKIQASKTDKEVGLRFPPGELAKKLIATHGHALVSTNLTHQLLEQPEDADIYSYLIEDSPFANRIKMIIDPGEHEFVGQSTIVDFSAGDAPEVIREGAGDISPFF